MSGITFQRRGDIPPATGDNGDRQSLGRFVAGSSLMLVCRQAVNHINAVSAPALVQWEGPYLRIAPHMWSENRKLISGNAWKIGDVAAGTGGNVSPATDGESLFNDGMPYYEIDAISTAPIYLPWDCTVLLYTNLAGIWLFDAFLAPYNPAMFKTEQVYAQTRRVAANASRELRTPLGCNSFKLGGCYDFDAGRTFTQYNEETGKAAGFGSSSIPSSNIAGDTGSEFPINGVRRMVVSSPVLAATSVVYQVRF